jgi:hypothetical protein
MPVGMTDLMQARRAGLTGNEARLSSASKARMFLDRGHSLLQWTQRTVEPSSDDVLDMTDDTSN